MLLIKRICLLVVLVLAVNITKALLPDDFEEHQFTGDNLQQECASRCPDLDFNQNRTDDTSEVGCGVRCKIDQCEKGCAAWEQALETSCQSTCNGTQELLPPKELYCVLGCHDALNRYFQQLKAEIGVPPAPALVADSLTATSLRLEWKGVDIKRRAAGISYLVQWRYEELAETWQYCRNQSWGEDDQILVENLQPYTKYRFRVALLLKSSQHNPEPIVSAPSVVILTLAAGRPTSAPVIDIPASENTDHYMFQNLKPNQNYSVSVSMRNAIGDGPPTVIYITTPSEPAVKDTQQPILILGGEHVVMKQGADMLDEPSIIYRANSRIRGVAIHVSSAQLFVSDSMGYIYRTTILKETEPIVVLRPDQANFKPLSLSVDWLNSHLYILGEVNHATTVWQIARCNLDGKGLTVAMAGFMTRPSHIEVDPYNGYLFWVTRGGLFRLDLADISNGIKHEVQPYLILEDKHLGAFTVDHTNFRLLVPDHTQNTVISVSLDGREILNLRANTQQPKFKNVVSLAMANGLFYWTNGEEVLTEGYHSGQNRYFHNAYPDRSDGSFVSVNVFMDASQPVPVPVNPPTGVQAVLGAERAKVSWQAPHLLGGQGKGAWQNWSYELEIKDELTGQIVPQLGIAGSSHTVYNLREKSEYTIKAAAYTHAGRGPWSTEFRGKTLRENSHASILWSANEGLLKSDVTGENVNTLIYKDMLKDNDNDYHHIIDVSWYKDTLYIVGNNSALYRYNITSHQKTKLNINSVGTVAVDWFAKKLYWANPKQQIITRANLNGTQQEPMSILAIVKELIIDSQEAYLYWSTGHAVEVARLNGLDRRYYHSDEIFNGKQVMGLTIDTENRYVYWIVRSYESGSIVYRAPTSERVPMTQRLVPEKVSSLQYPNIQGPLCYFSEHLLWLQDDRNAVIGDLTGQNTAMINGISLIGLHMVAIMDPALHQYPVGLTSDNITVIPRPVSADSIRVIGTWRNFNVTWDPVTNINYGTVFYEVKFTNYINTNSNPEITTGTTMMYYNSEQILPYSMLEVTIKAFTYWGAALHTRRVLRSPQSEPSQPTNVRGFVEFNRLPISNNINYHNNNNNNDVDITITFRWDSPEFPNGIIKGYTLHCWFLDNGINVDVFNGIKINHDIREYVVNKLKSNTTYYFEVQAFTEVGAGSFADMINISTEYEDPVPQLIVASIDALKLIDLDLKTEIILTRHIAIEMRYVTIDNKLYWINEMQEIVMANLNGSNTAKILSLNNTATSMCVDWISRNLYWSELHRKSGVSSIIKLDLSAWESSGALLYEKIIKSSRNIVNLEVSPLTGDLFWIELAEGKHGIIMQSDLYGTSIRPFFNHDDSDCSCPYRPLIKPSMTIDNTDPDNPVMYWTSLEGHLNIAGINGCVCNLVINPGFNRGLPPISLTVDKINVYWLNLGGNEIYYVNKIYPYEQDIKRIYLDNVRNIKAIGKSLQSYPNTDCLIPYQMLYTVEALIKKANSITIKLPIPETHLGCERYNLPGTLYTIQVSRCHDSTNCDTNDVLEFKTYKKEFEIMNLQPFTMYQFKLALSNYYSDMVMAKHEFGNPVVLRTAAGAPSAPQNVTVESCTPTLAAVYWLPPRILNAASVRYEIHWRTLRLVNGERPKGEKLIKNLIKSADGRFMELLKPLLPGQDYLVDVRAYPADSNDTYGESEGQVVSMYPEPNNLTNVAASVNTLNVTWEPMANVTINYTLEYTAVGLEKWQVADYFITNKNNKKIEYYIRGLLPRTMYKFRLILRYPNCHDEFIWPPDARFTFQTFGDVPSPPGRPSVTKLRNSVYQLNWKAAEAHGSQVEMYRLEGKVIDDLRDNHDDSEDNANENRNKDDEGWKIFYTGVDNYWIIVGEMNQKYIFRVQARNAYGFGEWSQVSAIVDLTDTVSTTMAGQQHLGLILGLSVPVITIVLLCFCYFLCLYNRQRKEVKKSILPPVVSDVELATLREIPRGNFVQSNALYVSSSQNDHDDLMLPKIRGDQLKSDKFLGSGAFGEVFQGYAKDLEAPGEITPVAIKTLRKGATAQEKTEFLQEAKLMSQFKHKHVLRLLGVCLDTDTPLLVLELMEAGDLLSYLRASRPLPPTDHRALRLQDLLAMCEDVARGCHYLESLHFVHRDIACRNCLVSARNRENRVVKIGDFGLARDIYKNDYYRKEGEGLLPVRWMSPESLVDGVFTTQSDVWAFGVLMWEITSLGQQPYPARSNIEVLHHVRAGGRLSKPMNCPPALHQLISRCWSPADSRPSFKTCLEQIILLRNNTDDAALIPVHAGHYLTRRGVSNMAYFADENQNHNSGNSWKSSSSEGSRDMQPFLQDSGSTTVTTVRLSDVELPKYLELLADNTESIVKSNPTDEYEVPRSIHIVTGLSDKSKSIQAVQQSQPLQHQQQHADTKANELLVRSEITPEDREHLDNILSQIGTLNTSERSKTLDNLRLKNNTKVINAFKNGLRASLNERTSSKLLSNNLSNKNNDECSKISLDDRNCSSLGSSITSLRCSLPSTRPSSSVLGSQHNLPLKNHNNNNYNYTNNNNNNSLDSNPSSTSSSTSITTTTGSANKDNNNIIINETNIIGNGTLRVHKNHANLEGSRANIPLVMNNVLLNLLRQPPQVIDDNTSTIVTYTNVNTDSTRVN
ncbi:proto-oncogene tyrosine-protein kinase ROS isoform X3 [Microplitis demolitor]|uniref:proto-oncogene tyrosine-protein kinase ROS isoform X3 n=1 Tax=Microplitis demolitor TaxID=69319 RepID=UPI0004CD3F7A|nr:proto-oncogene tyrosine-protein kinase ROS isoform X3 [Microplitis demolitor]